MHDKHVSCACVCSEKKASATPERRLEKSLVMSINFSGNQCRSSLKVCGLVKKFLNLM